MRRIVRAGISIVALTLLVKGSAIAAPVFSAGAELGTTSEAANTGTTQSVVTSPVKTGTYAFRTNPTTSATGYFEFRLPGADGATSSSAPNSTDCAIGFYFRYATAPASGSEEIASIRNTGNSADKATLRLTSAGNIALYSGGTTLVGTGSTALSSGTWYFVEFKAGNGTSYSYSVRINQTSELTGTADFDATNCGFVTLGKRTDRNSQTVDFFYDDLYYDDSAFASAIPDVRVLVPTANGTTMDWTGGTNSSNYAEVDDIPTDADTTYVKNSGGAANQTAHFNLTDSSAASLNNTIYAVKVTARCREDTSVTSAWKFGVYSGGSTSYSSTRDITNSYATFSKMFNTDPATSATWTTSGIDSMQAGAVETNSVSDRCTQILVHVSSYTAASAGQQILLLRHLGY